MSKVILVCGKICSGKSYYSNSIKESENAIIFSTDEATYDLIDNVQGEFYNEFAEKLNNYFEKKASELVKIGCNVILDFGFWTSEGRKNATNFFKEKNVAFEWHYVSVDDVTWYKNIEERNKKVIDGEGGSNLYVDDGLLNKVISLFEAPNRDEIDVWYEVKRFEQE